MLSKSLIENNIVDEIVVLTEHAPCTETIEIQYNGRLTIHRLFSHRAGAESMFLMPYIKYLFQNICYLRLPNLISNYSPDILLIHSSFHNYPNILTNIILNIKLRMKCKLIADVRDCLLPKKKLKHLEMYDAIIACSQNITNHITKNPILKAKTEFIPVIQEQIDKPSSEEVIKFFKKNNLKPCNYISYVGLIKHKKGVKLLFDAFCILSEKYKDLHLIIAGINKDPKILKEINNHNKIHYIGPISRKDAIILTSNSKLSINLSFSEGMPRICLEALALGVQVALPPNIPEFERQCSSHVVDSKNILEVANKLDKLLKKDHPPKYKIDEHSLTNVLKKYSDLFNKTLNY